MIHFWAMDRLWFYMKWLWHLIPLIIMSKYISTYHCDGSGPGHLWKNVWNRKQRYLYKINVPNVCVAYLLNYRCEQRIILIQLSQPQRIRSSPSLGSEQIHHRSRHELSAIVFGVCFFFSAVEPYWELLLPTDRPVPVRKELWWRNGRQCEWLMCTR